MKDYQSLLDYYKKCFSLVDCFHFNSETAKGVFSDYLPSCHGKVVSITHNGIIDHRKAKTFERSKLHIGFIGHATPYKGLPSLISVLQEIGMDSYWELSVWGGPVGKHSSLPIKYQGKFDTSSISSVYDEMDVLIVPSIWKETFSLVTLEALSYGVPVIVSNNVGAQDIVKLYDPKFVYHSENELRELLLNILNDRGVLKEFNDKILEMPWRYSMEEHAKEIVDKLYT